MLAERKMVCMGLTGILGRIRAGLPERLFHICSEVSMKSWNGLSLGWPFVIECQRARHALRPHRLCEDRVRREDRHDKEDGPFHGREVQPFAAVDYLNSGS